MSDFRREVERLRDWLLCDAKKSYPRSDLFSTHIADRLAAILDAHSDQEESFAEAWERRVMSRFAHAPSDQEGEQDE